jgi:PEP-CTERM motif-containing protein
MQTLAFRRVFLVGGISALVGFVTILSASAQTNYITDPGFELGTAHASGGWSGFNGAVLNSTAHVHSGTKSVRLPAGNGVGAFETISNVAFTAGTQFDLTAWGFITNQIATGFIGIQATFFNVTGTTTQNLGTVESGPGTAIFSNHMDSNTVLNTWIPLDTGVFTAPSTLPISYMQVFALNVNVTPAANAGNADSSWEDDFDLVIVPEPSTIALGLMGIGLPMLMIRRRRKA